MIRYAIKRQLDLALFCVFFSKKERPKAFADNLATRMRLELTTSAVTGRRSNQLNYRAKCARYCRRCIMLVEVIGLEPMTLCL